MAINAETLQAQVVAAIRKQAAEQEQEMQNHLAGSGQSTFMSELHRVIAGALNGLAEKVSAL